MNGLINDLYKQLEAKDKIINAQALELAKLKGEVPKIKYYYTDSRDFEGCTDAVKLTNDEIQEMVDKTVDDLLNLIKKNGEDILTFRSTGDTMVWGFVEDNNGGGKLNELHVFVCRGYEEACGWYNNDGTFEKMEWNE